MKTFITAAAFILTLGSNAFAGESASGVQINSAISGNTVQGSMVASGVYTEFYGADGVIKGKDYTGKWRVSGDTMCVSNIAKIQRLAGRSSSMETKLRG